ncbi:S8 family peptidase [Ruminococcus sp.]|uniref:S8 family peptidase n=1 Tax=Ruminococcus sp. TaxID=41978 RepID=UPI00388ED06F
MKKKGISPFGMPSSAIRLLSVLTAALLMLFGVSVPAFASASDTAASGALNNYLLGYMSWGVKAMGLDVLQEKLENSGKPLPEVIVAVIDSGLNTANPFLTGRYIDGYNFIADSSDYHDDQYHGTMTSGIIVDGTSSNVKILPIKVNDQNGNGKMNNVARGIQYAIEHHADVINLSLSAADANHTVDVLDDEIAAAVDAGIVVTVAAGNQAGDAADRYPANKDNILTITSLDKNNVIGEKANTGACVDFALPGVKIWAPYKTVAFVDTGTSLAAPHAAAAAALLKTWDKSLNQTEVFELLKQHAVDLGEKGFDTTYGWGMLDLSDFDINAVYVRPTEPDAAIILGDADGDGQVTSIDAALMQRELADFSSGASLLLRAADVDGDGDLQITDVTLLQRYLAEMDVPYSIGDSITVS